MFNFYLILFGLGVSCRILHSIVTYLYVSCSGSIASIREWDGLHYFIFALPGPCIYLSRNFFHMFYRRHHELVTK